MERILFPGRKIHNEERDAGCEISGETMGLKAVRWVVNKWASTVGLLVVGLFSCNKAKPVRLVLRG